MSTMTLKKVSRLLRKAAEDTVNPQYRQKFKEAANTIDAHLREREEAKASVTDKIVHDAAKVTVGRGALNLALNVLRRAGKDEVANELAAACSEMLASARVPDGCFVALTEPTEEQVAETVYNINRKTEADTVTPDMVRQVWSGMVHARPIKQVNAMLAATPKPEKEE